jgi:maltose-binding protein MalE
MNRWVRLFFMLLLLLACAPKADPNAVVLWTAFEGAEFATLKSLVTEFANSSGTAVVVLQVPFATFQQKMLIAGPARQGPDLLVGPHDWIGQLRTADLVAPIPRDIISPDDPSFYDIAKRCVTFNGEIYSAPLMMECVVLARNTSLCPHQPKTLDELVREATACAEKNPDSQGFAYEMRDFYFTGAFMAGFGADFLAPFSQPQVDLDALNFATPEGIAGATWVADLAKGNKYDLVPKDMRNNTAVELFLKGRMGMILCGPWNMAAIRQSGVPYVLEPLPAGPSQPCSPFVGVTGVMMSRFSTDKRGVKELMAYLASPDVTAQLCKSAARAPARVETAARLKSLVTDPAVARDLELFSRVAQSGTPMPNNPAVGATFWSAMQGAFELIVSGQVSAADELKETTERVRSKIRFMTE